MKDDYDILTLDEMERLCRLYLDCRLSPLEEAELWYVLIHTRFNTSLTKRTLDFMNVERRLGSGQQTHKRPKTRKRLLMSIAASLLVCFVAGLACLLINHSGESTEPLLALLPVDSVRVAEPLVEAADTAYAEATKPVTTSPVIPNHISKRTHQSRNASSRRFSTAYKEKKPSDEYVEIKDDEEVRQVFENIHLRMLKFVDLSSEIRQNLSDLNEVEKKIIEKI